MKTWKLAILALMIFLLGLALVVSCGDDDDDDDDSAGDDDDDDDNDDDDNDDDDDDISPNMPQEPWFQCTDNDEPEGATIVTAMELVDQYYTGDENLRSVDKDVKFPETGDWGTVIMKVDLTCPEDGDCDNWDRFAAVYLVKNPETKEEEAIELWRYITPYNIGMCMIADVTSYAPLLKGDQVIRSQVDTWVGPGSSQGHGWRVTVKFIFYPGTPQNVPDHVYTVWPYATVEVGNPESPISGQIGESTIALPDSISRAEMRLLITGHGQGNLNNCAEFCALTQKVTVNGTEFSYPLWRNDCHSNPLDTQAGTWQYSRAGWCPGAAVIPETFDILSAVQTSTDNTFVYTVYDNEGELYENTCRPGAGDGDNYCEGCAFDENPGNCDYNSGNHTTPVDKISVQLFVWE